MSLKPTTGVFFLQSANNSNDNHDFSYLIDWVTRVNGAVAFPEMNGERLNAEELARKVKGLGIGKIVLAGEDPGFRKPLFSRVMALAGEDPAKVFTAKITRINNDPERDRLSNIASLLSAVTGARRSDLFRSKPERVNEVTLVIGGGIAGIQASLEIADAGRKVYLLEKSATIGGHMAMFDKTFPTLDCAACILTPKMVEVGQHSNIEMLTYSELLAIDGEPGNFKAKILRKARRVNIATCIGCGTCSEKCPSKVPSEFDAMTSLRKAIYIPFPQAVPNKYLVDADNCRYVESGKCGVCAKVCPVENCIDLDQKDEIVEITVGNIIVATGFKAFDPSPMDQYGYGRYPNVITSLELERLINASGPTGGKITFRTTDKKGNPVFSLENGDKLPGSFAIIHCIGSRDEKYHKQCSRVCCMYSLKLAHLIREKNPEAPVYEFFIDMRAFGKGYEEFYERIRGEGIRMIRGKTAKIDEKDGKLILRSEDILADRLIEVAVDMVVLSVGIEPEKDSRKLAEMLKIKTDHTGWFNELDRNTDPVSTNIPGVYIAGVCQGPKDIPDTVAQASAAATKVLKSIIAGSLNKGTEGFDSKETELVLKELTMKVDELWQ